MKKQLRAPLILASASPRRKTLLEQAGYKFDVITPNLDEEAHLSDSITPQEYTKLLAREKALAAARLRPDAIVIGSDTIVYAQGQIIGKAVDHAHAREIIELLFSKPHDVITGLAVIKMDESIEIIESATTKVYPRIMSHEQIEQHIRSGNWEGKAGAYGIQETGDEFVERIEGSYTNVMGFPMELVEQLLAKFSINE